MSKGYKAVGLDGTLAYYDHWRGEDHIGDPIPLMLKRVKLWLSRGEKVKIMTARVSSNNPNKEHCRFIIQNWTEKYLGVRLEVTAEKDYNMVSLYDDRAIQVEMNTGKIVWIIPSKKDIN